MLFFLPLYTRISKEEVLDNETRGLIRGCIISEPGIHYKEIVRRCRLGNGNAIYHLRTLEREGLIKSRDDGRFKRFYPAEMKLSDVPPMLTRLQKLIFEVIREREGMSQLEIAGLLEASYPTVHRHINRMAGMGMLRLERHGMTVRCYIANGQTDEVK
jgi:predicted transcriptional regulator